MRVDNNYDKWNINKLPRNKNQQGTGGNGVVYLGSNSDREGNGFPELEGHYLWGQYFNGKQDVNGDLTTDGDINFYGNLNFMGEYDPNDDLHGNLNIGKVNAEDGHFTNLNADNFNALEAYIDNLTVTGSAHFFELIIDKIRSVGGAIMLTPGDGFELWGYNLNYGDQFNLWWVKTDDRNGKYNNWVIGDQALCRSFDSAQVGTSSNVNNKYWWAKVVDVDSTGKWCTKLHADDYNPDEVMKLPEGNDNVYYTNTHSYLKKTDFTRTDNYVYVETAHKNHWLTNEEYFYLDDSQKSDYEYSQLYAHTKEDGTVLQITELQYNNNNPELIELLIYDDVEDDWRLLRQFCKADCKFCFNITIDISQCANGSIFRVKEGSPFHYAYVFQEGDNIIMLGHQKQQTETEQEAANRQNAIYLCAGGEGDSIDSNLKPPFFAQYKGINNFNLESHRLTWFSGGWRAGAQGTQGYDNEIRGNLRVSTGETVEDYVGSQLIVEEDRIAMKVKSDISEAGITILDNQIILDADKTTVTGELTFADSNSGMVLYDENGNPVIKISNEAIGNFSDFNTSVPMHRTIMGDVNQTSWNITTQSKKIGTYQNNASLTVRNFGIIEYVETNGMVVLPSNNTATLTIELLLNDQVAASQQVTGTKNNAGTYYYNGSITFTNLSAGVYSIRCKTTGLSGSAPGDNPKIIYTFSYTYDAADNNLVRLANGGLSSNPAPNSFIWSNNEMQIMRQGDNAIRIYDNESQTNSGGVQILANVAHNIWHNYSNYRNTKTIYFQDLSYGTINGVSGNVYYYEIDVNDGYGYIMILPMSSAEIGGNDIYIRLPQCTPIGTKIALGYHIGIYDCDFNNKVHVISYEDGTHIMHGGLGNVAQAILSNDNSNGNWHGSEFIHVGNIWSKNDNCYWRATMPFS